LPCGTSYGAGVKSLLTSLTQEHLLPSARSCQLFTDWFGQPVSEGTLQTAVQTPPTHLFRQWSFKLTGFFWVKLPLGSPRFSL
jgi:hypothetical protein